MTKLKGWDVFSWPTNNSGDNGDYNWCYGMKTKEQTYEEHERRAKVMSASPLLLRSTKALLFFVQEQVDAGRLRYAKGSDADKLVKECQRIVKMAEPT